MAKKKSSKKLVSFAGLDVYSKNPGKKNSVKPPLYAVKEVGRDGYEVGNELARFASLADAKLFVNEMARKNRRSYGVVSPGK